MPRGRISPLGTVIVNANGYSQTKTEKGWVGTHICVLEKKLGRPLRSGEKAVFKDGKRSNLNPDNIELELVTSAKTLRAKIARWQAEVEDRLEWIRQAEETIKNSHEPQVT